MRPRPGIKLSLAALGTVAVCAAVILLVTGGRFGGASSAAPIQHRPSGRILRCVDRVERGDSLSSSQLTLPDPTRDTIIGPVAFLSLRSAYQLGASAPPRRNPWGRYQPVSSPILVRPGTTVTISVPQSERGIVGLIYARKIAPATSRVTLQACVSEHSRPAALAHCKWRPMNACLGGYTEFQGGLELNYGKSTRRRLACATVTVTTGRRRLVGRLFPGAGRCP